MAFAFPFPFAFFAAGFLMLLPAELARALRLADFGGMVLLLPHFWDQVKCNHATDLRKKNVGKKQEGRSNRKTRRMLSPQYVTIASARAAEMRSSIVTYRSVFDLHAALIEFLVQYRTTIVLRSQLFVPDCFTRDSLSNTSPRP